ncbi:MAG: phage virion morphogenesis protein [Zoogloeaceae bacterium]|jgi:phage virion morphogenesis protein|nr:phage virion morphogenesis protein [Zoogloeaceae bacterium]
MQRQKGRVMHNFAEIVGADRLEAVIDHMIRALAPAGRKKLLNQIIRRIGAENRKRIGKNVSPEGTAFAPRKTQRGKKRNGVKDRMFQKMKSAKWLKTKSRPDEARLFFTGGAANLARVHHYGLRDKLTRRYQKRIQYTARPLLGIPGADREMIEDMILARFAEAF